MPKITPVKTESEILGDVELKTKSGICGTGSEALTGQ
jgi:hypothetical protein